MMYEFLEKYSLDTPQDCHDWLPWKHLPEPPNDNKVKDGFRAVYLFSNPMNAVLSVFRRNYAHWHVKNMNMVEDYRAWQDDWDLVDFLDQGKDHFRMERHFRTWTQANRSYPILLVKFDALWDRLSEIFAFLGLPSEGMSDFPAKRERNSDWTNQPAYVRERLQDMYGSLALEVSDHDELKVI